MSGSNTAEAARVSSTLTRRRYRPVKFEDDYGGWFEVRREDPDGPLIGSRIEGSSLHAPVIDLDVPHKLLPSTTDGHSHLYIDVPMSWRAYKRLLRALLKAGVIEWGWYRRARSSRSSFVRRPGFKKGDPW